MTWSFADHMWDKALLEDTIQITREGKYDGIAARNKSYHYGLAKLNFASYNFKWRDSFKVLCIYKKNLLYCS